MRMEYVKELEGGEAVWKISGPTGHVGREVKTGDWDIDSYTNYCLFPIANCIKRMRETGEDGDDLSEYADILDRLYDAADTQLRKMADAIYKDIGWVKIVTTNEDVRGSFLQQDFLEVYVKKGPEKEVVTA